MALAVLAPSLHAEDRVEDRVENRVLLDFNMQTLPPTNWVVEGYAFGTHNPIPTERQKQALATLTNPYTCKSEVVLPPSASSKSIN